MTTTMTTTQTMVAPPSSKHHSTAMSSTHFSGSAVTASAPGAGVRTIHDFLPPPPTETVLQPTSTKCSALSSAGTLKIPTDHTTFTVGPLPCRHSFSRGMKQKWPQVPTAANSNPAGGSPHPHTYHVPPPRGPSACYPEHLYATSPPAVIRQSALAQQDSHLAVCSFPGVDAAHQPSVEVHTQRNELLWREIRKQGEIYSPRFDHAMVRRGGDVFLFGGSTGKFYASQEYLNDLYHLDTDSGLWTRLVPRSTSPRPRAGHSMVVFKKRLHVLAGETSDGKTNDLWTYDTKLNVWACRKMVGTIPPKRSHHTAVVHGERMLVYGGSVLDTPGTVHEFTFETKQWRKLPLKEDSSLPDNRQSHVAVVFEDCMYVFGGERLSGQQSGETSNDLWRLLLVPDERGQYMWERITATGDVPSARHGSASVLIGARWVVQGGREGTNDKVCSQVGDAMAYNVKTNDWQPLPESLVPFCQASRWGHQLCLIRVKGGGHCILLTGGVTLTTLPLH